jgi:hypothetical protein
MWVGGDWFGVGRGSRGPRGPRGPGLGVCWEKGVIFIEVVGFFICGVGAYWYFVSVGRRVLCKVFTGFSRWDGLGVFLGVAVCGGGMINGGKGHCL